MEASQKFNAVTRYEVLGAGAGFIGALALDARYANHDRRDQFNALGDEQETQLTEIGHLQHVYKNECIPRPSTCGTFNTEAPKLIQGHQEKLANSIQAQRDLGYNPEDATASAIGVGLVVALIVGGLVSVARRSVYRFRQGRAAKRANVGTITNKPEEA